MPSPSFAQRFTFVVEASVAELGLGPGDVLTLQPGDPEPLLLSRVLAFDLAAVRDALEAGQLRLCNADVQGGAFDALLPRRPRLQLVRGDKP
jgi:hypothetical protein